MPHDLLFLHRLFCLFGSILSFCVFSFEEREEFESRICSTSVRSSLRLLYLESFFFVNFVDVDLTLKMPLTFSSHNVTINVNCLCHRSHDGQCVPIYQHMYLYSVQSAHIQSMLSFRP